MIFDWMPLVFTFTLAGLRISLRSIRAPLAERT
jgi:hypothetical protein